MIKYNILIYAFSKHLIFENCFIFLQVRLADKYTWYSYVDIEQRVENLTKGLLELGLQPKKQIVIFAETRIEWMLICQACFRINVPGKLFAMQIKSRDNLRADV